MSNKIQDLEFEEATEEDVKKSKPVSKMKLTEDFRFEEIKE